ncbi:amino acid ABC transporter substrate-binding protein [Hyphomicrobium sp.]|uniref:amino acid ABC transporter substrate-binding protein n=1 Tax=Hyphomicrobium sp. TaxID=82 RepID=UPI002E2FDB94|nr:amino acid ABC transporter substrate-binding protein [Hyphomicrobium sp.]HEX2842708.1 amino acid ABC transporter substrate-binding protein [Hyphomicrobium sp.]
MHQKAAPQISGYLIRMAALVAVFGALSSAASTATLGATLDRIRDAGKITLGYETDAQPFSFADESGKPTGYSVALCERVVEQVKRELGKADLVVEWVPVELGDRLRTMQEKKVDLLCGADSVTLARRTAVGFSLPIFSSGIGALLRADAPLSLRTILTYGQPPSQPIWRGYPARTVLGEKTFAVVKGTRSEKWLEERINTFQLTAKVLPVDSHEVGVKSVLDAKADVFFADLPVLLTAALQNSSSGSLTVIDRRFTNEPIALSLERGDEDFRLTVDRALSEFYPTKEFRDLASKWFGVFAPNVERFVDQTALPQ